MASYEVMHFLFGGKTVLAEGKAMIVSCDYAFCIHNEGGKCVRDKISLSIDGLCEESVDRMKLSMAEEFLKKIKSVN